MNVDNNPEKIKISVKMQQHCFRRIGAEKSFGLVRTLVIDKNTFRAGCWRDARLALRSEPAVNKWKLKYRHIFEQFYILKKETGRGSKMISPIQYLLNSDRWSSESCGYSGSIRQ